MRKKIKDKRHKYKTYVIKYNNNNNEKKEETLYISDNKK